MTEPTREPSGERSAETVAADEQLLAKLADDFAARFRRGERPTVEEYVQQHPTLSERIRKVFRAISLIEESRPFDSVVAEQPGSIIGRYKLLERLGEGGFGTVFMAEQQYPVRRRVALKLIKAGLDTKQVIARFEAERQALALMDHENIAKVLDAGATESGRPYFVMELVHGVPITTYCDANRLSPRQRLELFIPVCRAVQHAHTKGIIHRDIKPTNVLVTMHDGVAVPKVIDFGVAKATGQRPLTDRTLFTQFAQMVGTPLYMSPEQAEMSGLDVDTRSDVYSLGVLLYELLTGTTPFDVERLRKAAFDEVRRIIRDEEPPKPSTRLSSVDQLPSIAANRGLEPKKLSGLVRGDLDWIVMRALEKDRARRYETANGMAQDVERYLHDEPVEACPPSARYRLRKFVKRNKRHMLAAGLVVLTLLGGIGGIVWQAVRANTERARAISERDAKDAALQAETAAVKHALAALRSLTDDVVERQLSSQPTLSKADRAFLNKILVHYEAFAELKGNTRESRAIRAEGYYKVGKLRFTLGERTETLAAGRRSLELYQGLIADFPDVPEYLQHLGESYALIATVLSSLGQYAEAERQYRAQLAGCEQLAINFSDAVDYRNDLASARHNLGNLLGNVGKLVEAESQHRQALVIREQLAAHFPAEPSYRRGLAESHLSFGQLLETSGKYAEAESEFRLAVAIQEQVASELSESPIERKVLGHTHNSLGTMLSSLGKTADAESEFRRTLAVQKQLAAQFPTVPDYRQDLAISYSNLGLVLLDAGKPADAEAEHRRALNLFSQLANDFPDVPERRRELGGSRNNLGSLLLNAGKLAEAEIEYRQALSIRSQLAIDFPIPLHISQLGTAHQNLGLLFAEQGKTAEAEAEYREALATHKQLAADLPTVAEYRRVLASAHSNLGKLLRSCGRRQEAESEHQEAVRLYKELAIYSPGIQNDPIAMGGSYCNIGIAVMELGRPVDAVDWYQRAIETLAPIVEHNQLARPREFLSNSHQGMAQAFEMNNDFVNAIAHWDRAIELDRGAKKADWRWRRALCMAQFDENGSRDAVAALRSSGDFAVVEAQYRQNITNREKLVANVPANADYRHVLGTTRRNLGLLLMLARNWAGAEAEYRLALSVLQQLPADVTASASYRMSLADAYGSLAVALIKTGKPEEAEAKHRSAVPVLAKLAAEFPGVSDYRFELAEKHRNIAALLVGMDKRLGAEAEYRESIVVCAKLLADFPAVSGGKTKMGRVYTDLGNLLYDLGRHSEAESEHRHAIDLFKQLIVASPEKPGYAMDLAVCYSNLGDAVRDGGKPADALQWYRQAITILLPVVQQGPQQTEGLGYLNVARSGLAISLVKSQDHAQAFAEVNAMLALPGAKGSQVYDAACVCALAADAAKDDPVLRERYARRAAEVLSQLASSGYFDTPASLQFMKDDKDLDAMRQREDYLTLLATLELKHKAASPPATTQSGPNPIPN